MSLLPDGDLNPSLAHIDRTGELVERYLLSDADGLDTDVQAFVAHHAALVRVVDALRASWNIDIVRRDALVSDGGRSGSHQHEGLAAQTVKRPIGRLEAWTLRQGVIVRVHHSGANMARLRTGRFTSRVAIACYAALCVGIFGLLGVVGSRTSGTLARTIHFTTAPGQRSTIRLVDGSTMLLAPASSASVTAQSIDVTGEAYFVVTPHAERVFLVRTRSATLRVLGTRFAIRQYPGERQSRIVVEDGRVAVVSGQSPRPSETRTIVSSQMVAVVSDSGVTITTGIATHELTSWTHGTLVFEHTAVRDVVAELTRVYGVDIRIADTALAARTVGIEVSVSSDPLISVLESLCTVLGAHYELSSRGEPSYVLFPGRVTSKSLPIAPARHLFPQPEPQYGR